MTALARSDELRTMCSRLGLLWRRLAAPIESSAEAACQHREAGHAVDLVGTRSWPTLTDPTWEGLSLHCPELVNLARGVDWIEGGLALGDIRLRGGSRPTMLELVRERVSKGSRCIGHPSGGEFEGADADPMDRLFHASTSVTSRLRPDRRRSWLSWLLSVDEGTMGAREHLRGGSHLDVDPPFAQALSSQAAGPPVTARAPGATGAERVGAIWEAHKGYIVCLGLLGMCLSLRGAGKR